MYKELASNYVHNMWDWTISQRLNDCNPIDENNTILQQPF